MVQNDLPLILLSFSMPKKLKTRRVTALFPSTHQPEDLRFFSLEKVGI